MTTLFVMILGIVADRFFPAGAKKKNEMVQLACTLLLIFSMGLTLGQQQDLFSEFGKIGGQSFLFFLLPTAGSAAVVYLLTHSHMPKSRDEDGVQDAPKTDGEKKAIHDPMMFYAIGALLLGIGCSILPGLSSCWTLLTSHSSWILYLLMFSVGISIGEQQGIFSKLLQYHVKIFIIPLGTIVGSLIGGMLCGALLQYPLHEALSISGSLGWYSLAGVSISSMAGASTGSIAFLSNLMREIGSFIVIPFVSRHLNAYSCVAVAGATSEDTTLPMIMRYTDEKTAVFSVINGIVCSTFVPVLFSFCY